MFYTEAQEILSSHAKSFGKETIPLDQAFGRVLQERIIADRDYPPFNRAAMDGYAFRLEDFQQGIRRFKIAATIFAGQSPGTALAAGQCYKIMTGAATPLDADAIVRREDTEEGSEEVTIRIDTVQPFQNIARRGEDLRERNTIIDKPLVIAPAVISLLAAIGKQSIVVEKLPRVAIITTGNEVRPIEEAVSEVKIRNSNVWLLRSLLAKQGIHPFSVQHIPDDPQLLQKGFQEVLDADIIIASGGVSAGDADFVPGVVESLGVKKLFHKLMIRPGKPIWCGSLPGKGMLFGLPGNPLSSMVTFTLFVQRYLYTCYGIQAPATLTLALEQERTKKNPLDEFFPVQLVNGSASVKGVPFNSSGDIRTALFADGLARHHRDKPVIQKGELVEYLPL